MDYKNQNSHGIFYRRKIRIRLTDPSNPDSYVCEIFDSSLEDKPHSFEDYLKTENTIGMKNDISKPKNFFDIIMSKESRSGIVASSQKKNEKLLKDSKLFKINEPEDALKSRKINLKRKTNFLKSNTTVNNSTSDSSDDENLYEIQRKFKVNPEDSIEENSNEKIVVLGPEKDEAKKIYSSKIDFLSQKKTLNILNYFTKIDTNPKISEKHNKQEKIQVTENSCKLNPKSLTEKNSGRRSCESRGINSVGVNNENFKLAPLFQKKVNSVTSLDIASQKARFEFLHKSHSNILKKSINKTELVLNFSIAPHIQQRHNCDSWMVRCISLPLSKLPTTNDDYVFKCFKKFSLKIKNPETFSSFTAEPSTKIQSVNVVKSLKKKYLDLKLNQVIDGLNDKNYKFSILSKEAENKYKATNDESCFEILNTLWTEKYKPRSTEILENENVVSKLRQWLQSWKTFDEELKLLLKSGNKSKISEDTDDDDSDAFVTFDNDTYGLKIPGNICILSGSNGCGKTALVFALANELEFSVLEVNSSSKRTGKKVLSDLQEATQSHKVHRTSFSQNEKLDELRNKGKNQKNKKLNDSLLQLTDHTSDSKISLILIEDADIVFEEQDEGFFSAISSLVQMSKRPLIFLTNDSNLVYLENFKNDQCLVLEMERPNFYKSCAVLEVVSLLEGFNSEANILERIVSQNNFDLRKSLLDAQFWCQFDSNSKITQKPFDLGYYWWGLTNFLFHKKVKPFAKLKGQKRKRMYSLVDSSNELMAKKFRLNFEDSVKSPPLPDSPVNRAMNACVEFYFRILDLASTVDTFRISFTREPIPCFDYKPLDSISLEENTEDVFWTEKYLKKELSEKMVFLSNKIFLKNCEKKENDKFSLLSPSWEEIRWRKLQEEANQELDVLVSACSRTDRRSTYVDYLPVIRNICRIERNRSTYNSKRKNRFCHYLNNLGIKLTERNLNLNSDTFFHYS